MPRVALDLNTDADRQKVKGQWRLAEGLVPGEPNEGLTARMLASPPRLPDFDDSGWRICPNVRESLSEGFTFAWYRMILDSSPNQCHVEPAAAAKHLGGGAPPSPSAAGGFAELRVTMLGESGVAGTAGLPD